ncbi:hypothetical protein [Streptomyces sp. 16-176A]|uniref:hypothetical protein n=1 Tax=Streptomyces sp. 16-176A TaxID=2530458 RepID=UPI00345CFBC6
MICRVVAETVDGRTTRFAYDAAGRRTARITPTGVVARSAYDEVGNRTALRSDGHTLTFAHDSWGKEVARSFGPAGAPVTLHTRWSAMGRLTSQSPTAGDRALRARASGYRTDGHLEHIVDELHGARKDFELDPVGRPLRVTAENWTESYAYDAAGNEIRADWPDRAARTEGRGGRSVQGTRVLSAGRIRYEYDAAGRTVMRQKTRLSRKPDTWRYTWDEENRLLTPGHARLPDEQERRRRRHGSRDPDGRGGPS